MKQISSANVAQSRQTELIPDGKQTVVSTVVTGLASNLNTLFTVLVQSATGELQFSKMVLKQSKCINLHFDFIYLVQSVGFALKKK